MKTRIVLLFLSLLTGFLIHAQDLSVIGNPNGTPSGMSQAKLKSYFKGEIKTWGNGSKVILALMKSNTAPGGSTCGKVFQMSCDAVTKYWLGKAMESNTTAPVFFNSVGELQAFVKNKPGAIGIIDLSAPVAGVRVIQIDGKNSF
jgi:ABC-type phosphate transport system substrate-binding protein